MIPGMAGPSTAGRLNCSLTYPSLLPSLPPSLPPSPPLGMMKMIPGMAGVLPGEAMYEGEKKLFAYQEMINVMEPEERSDPKMLLDNPGMCPAFPPSLPP